MKRTPYILLSILCMVTISCASSSDNQVIAGNAMESPTEQVASAEEDQRLNKPGAPQATKPEEMHGHTFNATGGMGTIERWRKNNPPLASPDLRHPTVSGQRQVATLLYHALMKEYASYRQRQQGKPLVAPDPAPLAVHPD